MYRNNYNKQMYKKRKRYIENILSFLIFLSIILGGVTGYYGSKVYSFLDGISETNTENQDKEQLEKLTKQLGDNKPFSAIILGTDAEEHGKSRSDSIIVVTVNPQIGSMKLVSIPRDTLIVLPNGTEEKINAAYAIGGAKMTQEIIEEMLNIPVQFYATMDFRGLVELVDAVGGITIDSELEFTQDNYVDFSNPVVINKGINKVDGAEALGYARMRKQDPRGDFGRQDRQKEVIVGVLNELLSFNTITNMTGILDSVQPYLKTNASGNQMLAMALNYTNVLNDVEQLSLNGKSGESYFPHYGLTVYVWEPFKSSLNEVSTTLRIHLGLEDGIPDNEENKLSEDKRTNN